jgi:hypothetical protein
MVVSGSVNSYASALLSLPMGLQVVGGAEGIRTFILKFDSGRLSTYNKECIS